MVCWLAGWLCVFSWLVSYDVGFWFLFCWGFLVGWLLVGLFLWSTGGLLGLVDSLSSTLGAFGCFASGHVC
eukprot:m.14753 g.14753  ORF g.14753 m.14753 type:complete len:71 (+) comp4881_c0_seq1:130-342(+)